MLNEGYKPAFAIPTWALEMFNDNSALFTSGLLLTIAEGKPAESCSGKLILFRLAVLARAPGSLPAKMLNAFS
ncbi:hypothetical protein D3C85_1631460 [compost metagenome]